MAGCGCTSYGRAEPSRSALRSRERELSIAIRAAARDGDALVAARLGSQLAEVRAQMGIAPSSIPALSDGALASVPAYRRPGAVEARLDVRSRRPTVTVAPYAEVQPISDEEVASFSLGAPTVAGRIRSDEALARSLFRRDMAHLGSETTESRAQDFDRFLSLYRRLGRSIGASGGASRPGFDPRVERMESMLRGIFRSEDIPAWYTVVTGRLFPMYVREGAESVSFGYLRPGYGS